VAVAGSAAEAFHDWHDFYLLLSAAAATLIGAMFVVASIGSSFLTRQHGPQIRAFLTPTVIHLSSVVLASAVATVPSLEWRFLGLVYAAGGGAGMIYSLVIGWNVARRRVEWSDQIWYALIPVVGYGIILAAALTIFLRAPPNFEALAVGVLLLLVASIRNAWDLIIFFAARDNSPPE
jgi:drug/metabolite transporter superfamily protein YnfA